MNWLNAYKLTRISLSSPTIFFHLFLMASSVCGVESVIKLRDKSRVSSRSLFFAIADWFLSLDWIKWKTCVGTLISVSTSVKVSPSWNVYTNCVN